ncbi:hypothetical protein DFH09DRAFT_1451111 [Mycena vulgaris]|nr:hypothetical protein DFH09DRAFT_1451111 [Mycena vulgaris]
MRAPYSLKLGNVRHLLLDLSQLVYIVAVTQKVATAFADEIKGKNFLITGTSLNGMGFEATRTIAKHANLVVITCPNAERSIFCAVFNQFLLTAVQGPTFYHLTDALLTIIEGKPRYRQAFGLDKGQSGPVDTGGNKIPELCSDVAKALFLPDETDPTSKKPENTYTADDLPSLSGVVKTRGQTLKTKYQAYHKNLGATGHGLVTADREKEIITGTEIANAGDEIAAKFPWYKRMDLLTSPIVNCSALAHSQTRVDLGILDRDGEVHDGPISIHSDDDTASKISWEATPPPGGHADDGSDDDKDTLSTSSPCRLRAESVPTIPSVKKVKVEDHPAPLSSARGSKRKSMHDHIQELTSQDHIQCVKLAELKKQQKTVRAQAKYDAKTQLEMARLQHQQREAERQLNGVSVHNTFTPSPTPYRNIDLDEVDLDEVVALPVPGEPLTFPWDCQINTFLEHATCAPARVYWNIRTGWLAILYGGPLNITIPLSAADLLRPATRPLLSHMYVSAVALADARFPWKFMIGNPKGIRVRDVFGAIMDNFRQFVGRAEFHEWSLERQQRASLEWRLREKGNEGMRRID